LQRAGRIKIAATDTVMGYFLMPHLARFKARYPRVAVEVVELDRAKIESALMEGKLDLAVTLVSNIQQNFELISSVLVPSQRRLWLPSRHHLLNKQSISLRDVAKEPLIMLTVDEAADTAKTYWEHAGLSPMTAMKSANVEAVRTAVARGLGVAVLSDMVYRSWSLEGDRIEVRDLKERIPSMDVGLTWKLGATLSPLAQEFHDFLKNAYLGAAK
jgi:DNA-binding transcriptional LysR family regulator